MLACQNYLLVPPRLLHALPVMQAAGVNLLFDAHLVCWHFAGQFLRMVKALGSLTQELKVLHFGATGSCS